MLLTKKLGYRVLFYFASLLYFTDYFLVSTQRYDEDKEHKNAKSSFNSDSCLIFPIVAGALIVIVLILGLIECR